MWLEWLYYIKFVYAIVVLLIFICCYCCVRGKNTSLLYKSYKWTDFSQTSPILRHVWRLPILSHCLRLRWSLFRVCCLLLEHFRKWLFFCFLTESESSKVVKAVFGGQGTIRGRTFFKTCSVSKEKLLTTLFKKSHYYYVMDGSVFRLLIIAYRSSISPSD